MDMYERIQRMDREEMQMFIYWVYANGVADGMDNSWDSYGKSSYFGGHVLDVDANIVMPKVYELCV